MAAGAALPERPNFVLIITDEERFPPAYTTAAERAFRAAHLPARARLAAGGVTFSRHYTASTACSPSRASLFTGHYPDLTGVTQTYGGAKGHADPELRWLEPDTVPTMGDYLRAAGYETAYIGKWHISFADLVDEHGHAVRDKAAYARAAPLDEFGFGDWTGPDPHGPEKANSGWERDPGFAADAAAWLQRRAASGETRPFLLVVSLTNPHDIVFFPYMWRRFWLPEDDPTVPRIPEPASATPEGGAWASKPSLQQQYRDIYKSLFSGQPDPEGFRRFYLFLHKIVDKHMGTVLDALEATELAGSTIVMHTSDHGECATAHGMVQKWASAYDEVLRVPLVIALPDGRGAGTVLGDTVLSSSVDLLPTMLGLAGIDEAAIRRTLADTHSETAPLVGRDLSPYLVGRAPWSEAPVVAPVCVLEDNIARGSTQVPIMLQLYPPFRILANLVGRGVLDCLQGATSIEALVAPVNGELFKIARYWENPALWTVPHVEDHVPESAGARIRHRVSRTPAPEEWEVYNLSRDPCEVDNLATRNDPIVQALRRLLASRTAAVRVARRHPRPKPRPLPPHLHHDPPVPFWRIAVVLSTALAGGAVLVRWGVRQLLK